MEICRFLSSKVWCGVWSAEHSVPLIMPFPEWEFYWGWLFFFSSFFTWKGSGLETDSLFLSFLSV
jgi:hypothetical protein